MTSLPCRSWSLCQSFTAGSPSVSVAAKTASSSQLEPGKLTMPNFMR